MLAIATKQQKVVYLIGEGLCVRMVLIAADSGVLWVHHNYRRSRWWLSTMTNSHYL